MPRTTHCADPPHFQATREREAEDIMTAYPVSEAQAAVAEAALRQRAEQVQLELCRQDSLWDKGFTRRKFLAGAGMAGVATLGSQLVTSKVAYAAAGTSNGHTLITVFLRGAADGLRALVPAAPSLGLDYLHQVRPKLVPASLPLSGANGWALNSQLAPLLPFWSTGELAFVPAVSIPGLERSHFQAQQLIEHGGSATASNGWLDRTLAQLGPGTTFRAVAEGSALPASMAGSQQKVAMNSLANFTFPGWDGIAARSEAALRTLYRGVSGPLGTDVPTTIAALATAARARSHAGVANGAVYPNGNFGKAMADLATLLRSEVGLQVATVDVGGWDTHTDEANQLDRQLDSAAKTLAAFLTDLGPVRRRRVTVVVLTEFGRRVAMNDSGGTDHGHGSVLWLLGGGLSRSAVFGSWRQLSAGVLDQGDVPAWNNGFDVLGELLQKRLGIGRLDLIFPGHRHHALGVAKAG
jgi:uncharacterized protein (DUF1501 family)